MADRGEQVTEPELKLVKSAVHGNSREVSEQDRALLNVIAEKSRDARDTSERFFADMAPDLVAAARTIAAVYRRGGRLFAMGNGGSSCDAAHLAVEFLHPITAGRPALPAINLTAEVAMVSAVSNDVGYEHVFVRQILALGRPGDALIGITTSGNSANLLAAFTTAREIGMVTIALTGGDGGRAKSCGAIDHCLVVSTQTVHRVQECHVMAYHILWDLVHTILAEDRGASHPCPA
jgi:D-sedoheptulose 7-phosphate isomerase